MTTTAPDQAPPDVRPDHQAAPLDEGRPDVRRHRHRRRAQRPGQRRVSRQVRPQDARPRTPSPRRRRGDHRGAATGLLVHDVLVRPQPAAAGHHPRARTDQARLHAAADVVVLRPDGERRLPVAHPGPQREPQGDRAPLQARRRRLRPVRARHRDGLPGDQAAARHGPAGHLQQRPRGAHRARVDRLALPQARQARPPQRRPPADRQRGRLPRRLLRVGHRQGLPRVLEHHRDEGRTAVAGLGPRPALPLARRARRRVRGVGLPQGRQRRVHPGARAGGPVVRGGDRPRVAGRTRHHEERPGDRRRPPGRHRVLQQRRRLGARPAADVPRARPAARAAGRPRREHRAVPVPGHVIEGELRPRRSAQVPGPGRPRRHVPRLHQHRPVDGLPRACLRRREVRLVQPAPVHRHGDPVDDRRGHGASRASTS